MSSITKSLSYTSLLVSLTAMQLTLTTHMVFSKEISYEILLLVFSGTFAVYTTDHIRGIEKDIDAYPDRAFFVNTNRSILTFFVTIFSGMSVLIVWLYLSAYQIAFLIPALLLGLLHRKIKGNLLLRCLYITVAWCLVVVMLPLHGYFDPRLLWYLPVITLTLYANAISYATVGIKNKQVPAAGLLIAFTAAVIAFAAPVQITYVAAIPASLLLTLLLFRNEKCFKEVYLDGSVFAGALVCSILNGF